MTDRSQVVMLIKEAVSASKSEDAVRWTQAAVNVANALKISDDATAIATLVSLAATAKKSEDAMRWSQAAVNAANARAVCIRS